MISSIYNYVSGYDEVKTETEAEIVDVRKSSTEVSYKTLSDDGTIYPVSEKNVIGRV